jgi:hypothetical protein
MKLLVDYPENPLSKTKIDEIIQIEYILKSPHDYSSDDVIALNTLLPRSDSNPYHWVYMPVTYHDFLKRIFYRLELVKLAALHSGKNKIHIEETRLYLSYLDATLDQIWDENAKADRDHCLTKDWRSPTFDQWLAIEHKLRLHMPYHINEYIEEDKKNIDSLTESPWKLGKLHFTKHLIVIDFR